MLPAVDNDAIAAAWPKGEGVRGPMLELIGYDRQYDEVAAYLLGDVLVVEDLERALTLWRETHTTKTIVTLEGEVIDPQGVVTGGSRESAVAGVLEQKREIRELEAVMARLDADVEAALARQIERKQARGRPRPGARGGGDGAARRTRWRCSASRRISIGWSTSGSGCEAPARAARRPAGRPGARGARRTSSGWSRRRPGSRATSGRPRRREDARGRAARADRRAGATRSTSRSAS